MSVTHTLLISADTLKQNTTISQSVSEDLIHPVILLSQDRYILPVLGTDLFEKLKTEIAGTPSGVYLTLLKDYVQKCLCQFTLATLYPVLRLRAVNHSVVQMNNEQGTSVSFEDIEPLISSSLDMGEFYRERLISYLCDNSSSFPEYTSNTGSDLNPTTRNYYSGINMEPNVNSRSQLEKAILAAVGVKNIC
tara:strand:+ start:968 stop:1543 length:576 start_codon:yes stop_codon:yes gene_type:complete